jgi:hypothetical protein
MDGRGSPVAGAETGAEPPAIGEDVSQTDGRFTLGLATAGTYALTACHPHFGPLPPMSNLAVEGDLEDLRLYLPPAPNLVLNGGFEEDGAWNMAGPVPPARREGSGHTGSYALEMGATHEAAATGWPPSVTGGEPLTVTWVTSQTISLPSDTSYDTLSWLYRMEGEAAPGNRLYVSIKGSSARLHRSLPLDKGAWTHGWMDLADLPELTEAVVQFTLVREPDDAPLVVWLDEVTLGSVHRHRLYLPHVPRSP